MSMNSSFTSSSSSGISPKSMSMKSGTPLFSILVREKAALHVASSTFQTTVQVDFHLYCLRCHRWIVPLPFCSYCLREHRNAMPGLQRVLGASTALLARRCRYFPATYALFLTAVGLGLRRSMRRPPEWRWCTARELACMSPPTG